MLNQESIAMIFFYFLPEEVKKIKIIKERERRRTRRTRRTRRREDAVH